MPGMSQGHGGHKSNTGELPTTLRKALPSKKVEERGQISCCLQNSQKMNEGCCFLALTQNHSHHHPTQPLLHFSSPSIAATIPHNECHCPRRSQMRCHNFPGIHSLPAHHTHCSSSLPRPPPNQLEDGEQAGWTQE